MGTGFLYITGIFLSGILTLVCLILGIISFANSKNGKFYWLIGFLISLCTLLLCIYLLINRIKDKAGNFMNKLEHRMEMNIDTAAARQNYYFSDSIHSKQIQYLKLIEPEESKGKIPDQFYSYLGFRDYFRMPLRYPFSIHCIDQTENGSLYNEENVERFDASDNGEKSVNIDGIIAFSFDAHILLARQLYDSESKTEKYIIYFFDTGNTEEFNTSDKMNVRARELNFNGNSKLVSCKDYFELLN